MQTFGQKRNPLRLFGKRLLLLSLIVLIMIAISGVWGVYKKERESREMRSEAEAKLADLEGRKTQLGDDITRLKTSRGLEEALREQYRLAKSGEGLIIIVEPPTPQPIATTSAIREWFNRTLSWW